MATVISIDVGVKHFAFFEAVFDRVSQTYRVTRWKVEDIYKDCPAVDDNEGTTIDDVVRHTVTYLTTRFCKIDVNRTFIFVERQVPRNMRAFTLAHAIVTYFVTRGVKSSHVFQVNATSKPIPPGVHGKQRKTKATLYDLTVENIHQFCSNGDNVEALLKKKNSQLPKLDDLCDCLLQAVGNIHLIGYA